jgi:hypothetical protein
MSHAPPPVGQLAAPTNLRATAGYGRVALHWSASEGATSYTIYRDGAAIGTPPWTATCFTDTGDLTNGGTDLTNGRRYCYFVTAVNAAGVSPPSSTVCATPGMDLNRIRQMTWPEYYGMIEAETDLRRDRWPNRCRPFGERLQVIRQVRALFASHPHFNCIPPSERRMIAGLVAVEGIDFGWFGTMLAAGSFKGFICNNNQRYTQELNAISQALDLIPPTGGVSRGAYVAYERSLPKGCAIGAGTRLLAMKRPDTFVCVCGGNRQRLCPAFNTAPGVGLERYWDKIIMEIQRSAWWNAPPPNDGVEREVWEARAAFLDSLFYEYSGDPCPGA